MLKEEQIRCADKGKLIDRMRVAEIKKFFLDKNDRLIKGFLRDVNCPACSSDKGKKEFIEDKFTFIRCGKCNTLFVSPRPLPEKLLEYYKRSKAIKMFMTDVLEKTASIRKEMIFKPRAKKLASFLFSLNASKNTFAEIGGGNGLFIEILRKARVGFREYLNIEPSAEGARLSQRRNITVIPSFLESVEGVSADCICAFELIEHVFDPVGFCKKVNRLLTHKGAFVFTTPNIEGLDLMLLGKDSDNICPPNHLNYFNIRSISLLLERTGFEVLSVETPGELDVDILRNKVRNGYKLKDRFISYLLDQPLKEREIFQEFLKKNRLSSSMYIVARKRERN